MSYLEEMAGQGYNSDSIGPFHQFMVPWLLEKYRIGREEEILDIGAGQGHCLIPLYHQGWRHLTAIDINDFNFEKFESKYGFETLLCDIGSQVLPLKNESISAVLCFHLIEHLPKPDNLLSEVYRVLKFGGKCFLVTPDWRKQYKTFWRDPTHLRPFDKQSIARLLRMYDFDAEVHSWNPRYGMGRLRAYKLFPRLGMIGEDMIAIGTKT